jgi:predicted O-methyltransferase YrrM
VGPTEAIEQILVTQGEPTDARYRCFNTGGVEVEVGEFLYGLVRMVKPDRVLETGTHKGISASYMGLALRENAQGVLTTVDLTPENVRDSGELFATLGLQPQVEQVYGDAAQFVWGHSDPIDILFLDTEPQTRFGEMLRFFPEVREGGFILIHDLHHHLSQEDNPELGFGWPYGRLPDELKRLIDERKLRLVHFRTPRGFTLFYKPAPEDYGEAPGSR